jgi:hypothetical protein
MTTRSKQEWPKESIDWTATSLDDAIPVSRRVAEMTDVELVHVVGGYPPDPCRG